MCLPLSNLADISPWVKKASGVIASDSQSECISLISVHWKKKSKYKNRGEASKGLQSINESFTPCDKNIFIKKKAKQDLFLGTNFEKNYVCSADAPKCRTRALR